MTRAALPRFPAAADENEAQFRRALEIWCQEVVGILNEVAVGPDRESDSTRGTPTAGRLIFNTDDGQLNVGDGSNWTLPDGTTT